MVKSLLDFDMDDAIAKPHRVCRSPLLFCEMLNVETICGGGSTFWPQPFVTLCGSLQLLVASK